MRLTRLARRTWFHGDKLAGPGTNSLRQPQRSDCGALAWVPEGKAAEHPPGDSKASTRTGEDRPLAHAICARIRGATVISGPCVPLSSQKKGGDSNQLTTEFRTPSQSTSYEAP